MSALRTRWLPLIVCAIWTALLSWLWLSGTYMNYLNVKLWPLLAVGGALGLLFTLALLWPTTEAAAATRCCGPEHEHDHEHEHEPAHEHQQACEHEHGAGHDHHHHHHHEHSHGDCGGHAQPTPARCCGDEGNCGATPPRAGGSVLTRSGPWLQAALVLLPVLYLVRTPGAQLDSYAFALRQVEAPAQPEALPEEQAAPVEASASTKVTVEVEAKANVNIDAEAQALPGADAAGAEPVVEAKPALPVNLLQIGRGLAEFKGERIVTEGMYFRGERVPRLHFVLFRFSITCCAADAMPLSVLVKDAPQMPDVDVDQWVRVEGVVQSMEFEGRQTGVVVAEQVTPIETPDNPFMIDTGPNGGGW